MLPERRRPSANDEELPPTTKTLDALSSILGAMRRYRDFALRRGNAADAAWADQAIDGVTAQHARLNNQLRDATRLAFSREPQALIGSAPRREPSDATGQASEVSPSGEEAEFLRG